MEKEKTPETGYRIDRILLTESVFKRRPDMVFDNNGENHYTVNSEVDVKGDSTVGVVETVDFHQTNNGVEQFSIKVTMVGVFKVVGVTEIKDLDLFGKVNGSAIIYPYIREHISNCVAKAGIGALFLPPMNFTAGQHE